MPILDALFPTLSAWRLRHPGRLVFANRNGRRLQPSARIFQEVLHRVLDAAGPPMIERKGKLRRYFVFHDFRHTLASLLGDEGWRSLQAQKILGHKTVQMTMRYAHLQPTAFAGDLGRLSTVTEPAAVIPLHAKQPAEVLTISDVRVPSRNLHWGLREFARPAQKLAQIVAASPSAYRYDPSPCLVTHFGAFVPASSTQTWKQVSGAVHGGHGAGCADCCAPVDDVHAERKRTAVSRKEFMTKVCARTVAESNE